MPRRAGVGPTVGGGPGDALPAVEANRIGCDVQGFDINPMAAWVVREGLERLDISAKAIAEPPPLPYLLAAAAPPEDDDAVLF